MSDQIEADFIESDLPSYKPPTTNSTSINSTFSHTNSNPLPTQLSEVAPKPSNVPPSTIQANLGGSNQVESDAFRATRGTLDESIARTLKRDIKDIDARLRQVVYPHFPTTQFMEQISALTAETSMTNNSGSQETSSFDSKDIMESCDMWAPLLFVIIYSLCVSHAKTMFSSLFVSCWFLLLVMALHLRLINPFRHISLITYISLSGYCLYPQVINAIISQAILPALEHLTHNNTVFLRIDAIIRLVVLVGCLMWSLTSISLVTRSTGFLEIFPLGLCLLGLGWLSTVL